MGSVILRLRSVIERTGLSRSTIYLQMSEGSFPANVSIGKRAVGWSEAAIEAWVASRTNKNQFVLQGDPNAQENGQKILDRTCSKLKLTQRRRA